MSLINQVLNQLEQRGAHTAPNQTQVRAVAVPVRHNWIVSIGVMAAILLGLTVAWLWMQPRASEIEVKGAASEVVVAPVFILPDVVPEVSSAPASKLSYELGSLPLPSSLRKPQSDETEVQSQPPTIVPPQAAKPVIPKIKPMEIQSAENKPMEVYQPNVSVQATLGIPLKQISRTQQADSEYRKALAQQQQGHIAEALAGYEAALKLNAQHESARTALAALLMESKRGADAERVLQEGLKIKPRHIAYSMALARVQVEQGHIDQALLTMQKNLPQADDKADYQAFYAALLQRQGRHKEAVNHYQIAVQLAPSSGIWLMGYAISLQEVQRLEDAKSAYQKALATQSLSPELTAFVQQKLKGF